MKIEAIEINVVSLSVHLKDYDLRELVLRAIADHTRIPYDVLKQHTKYKIEQQKEGSPSYNVSKWECSLCGDIPASLLPGFVEAAERDAQAKEDAFRRNEPHWPFGADGKVYRKDWPFVGIPETPMPGNIAEPVMPREAPPMTSSVAIGKPEDKDV